MKRVKVRNKTRRILTESTPCAVVEYYEWFKMDRLIENKKYELMYLNKKQDAIRFIELREDELRLFWSEQENFSLVEDTKHGKVWERNDFKAVVKEANPIRKR